MAKILFDKQHLVEMPSLVLQNRNFDTIGMIGNASGLTYKEHFNSANELSFTVYKELNGQETPLWDSISDFKILYIPELQERFEITVSTSAEHTVCKSVTAVSLCESELGQIILRDIEINTESDILNSSYDPNFPTVFYRNPNDYSSYDWNHTKHQGKYKDYTPEKKKELLRKSSLLHRIFEKAPHYSFKAEDIDDSLKNLQREFSISETDLYGELTGEIAEEFHCLFLFNSINRTLSVHDLYNTCHHCNYRGDFSEECPECKNTDFSGQYGTDTSVFISKENLAAQINLETDSSSLKNCFYVEGGDEIINAAIRSCNPNGSQYLYYFSEETKKDMPSSLKNKINDYDALCTRYNTTEKFFLDQKILDDYNSVVRYVNDKFPNDATPLYAPLTLPLAGYPATTLALYEVIDLYAFLKSSMLPSISIDGMGLKDSLTNIITGFEKGFQVNDENGNITVQFQNEIAIQNHTNAIQSTVERAILNTAKLFYSTAHYDLTVHTRKYTKAASTATGKWIGTFTLTSCADSGNTETTAQEITLKISGSTELFIQQSIYRTIADKDNLKDKQISSLQLSEKNFKERLQLYSLDELNNLRECFQACLNIITSSDIRDNTLKTKYHGFYFSRIRHIDTAVSERDRQLKAIEKLYYQDSSMTEPAGILYELRKDVNNKLNFETYIGEKLWKLFLAYRREYNYSNPNYISDGLTSAEVIMRTDKLLDSAKKELYKAGNLQYSITTTMNNLMAIKEFRPLIDSFAVGNWIRIGMEDKIFKLRLLSYQINFDELQTIDVEFSTVEKIQDGSSDLSSILNSASSMVSSYQGLVQQADKTAHTNAYVNKWLEQGFTATQTKFANADNQCLIIDQNGLLARSYDDISDVYSPYQLKIVNNGLYTTSDGWETIDTGIGRISYFDPDKKEFVESYGLIAQSVVGRLFLGEQLGIYSVREDGTVSLRFDNNGLMITNGTNTVVINPNDEKKLFRISAKTSAGETSDVFYTDAEGNLHLKGDITATSGTFNGIINATGGTFSDTITCTGTIKGGNITGAAISGSKINIGENFAVTSTGFLTVKNASISGTITAGAGSKIGGFTSTATAVYVGKTALADGNNGVYMGTNGISLGANNAFTVTNTGAATCKSITITGGSLTLGSNFSVTTSGDLTAKNATMYGKIYCDKELYFKNWYWDNIYKAIGVEAGYQGEPSLCMYRYDGFKFFKFEYDNHGDSSGLLHFDASLKISENIVCRDINCKSIYITEGINIHSGMCTSASHLRFTNNKGIYGANTSGTDVNLAKINTSNNIHIGADGYNLYIHSPSGSVSSLSDRFRPETDDLKYCGDSSHRWKRFYAVNGTISTSDRNYKKNIRDIPDALIQLFLKLQPKIFQFLNGDRDHIGAISQDVWETMKELGIKDTEFAGFCRDLKMKNIIDPDTGDAIGQEPVLDADGNPEYIYSLCYQEFIFLLVAVVQQLYGKVDNLENAVLSLKTT